MSNMVSVGIVSIVLVIGDSGSSSSSVIEKEEKAQS